MAAIVDDVFRRGVGGGEDTLERVLIEINACAHDRFERGDNTVSVGAKGSCLDMARGVEDLERAVWCAHARARIGVSGGFEVEVEGAYERDP